MVFLLPPFLGHPIHLMGPRGLKLSPFPSSGEKEGKSSYFAKVPSSLSLSSATAVNRSHLTWNCRRQKKTLPRSPIPRLHLFARPTFFLRFVFFAPTEKRGRERGDQINVVVAVFLPKRGGGEQRGAGSWSSAATFEGPPGCSQSQGEEEEEKGRAPFSVSIWLSRDTREFPLLTETGDVRDGGREGRRSLHTLFKYVISDPLPCSPQRGERGGGASKGPSPLSSLFFLGGRGCLLAHEGKRRRRLKEFLPAGIPLFLRGRRKTLLHASQNCSLPPSLPPSSSSL